MTPSNDLNQQIPVYESLPEKWEDAKLALVERTKKIANAINIRPVGWEIDEEILTGKKFIPITGSQEYRDVFRKTFDVGPLPNATTKNIPHNISDVNSNFRLLAMWGGATNQTTFFSIPLPYTSITNNHVDIKMDATNIIITTNINYSGYNDAVIIIEYTTRM